MEGAPNEKKNEEHVEKFEDAVELDVTMSVGEAVSAIANFHGTSDQAVLDAFLNLREAKNDETVIFSNSVSNGQHCLKIEIYDKTGARKVFSLIDSDTGQPIAHTS